MLPWTDGASVHGRDWWTGQSRWAKSGTVCAVVFVAITAACAALLGWGSPTGHHPSPPVPRHPDARQATATAATAFPGSPIPADVTWWQVGLGALPYSHLAGPAAVRAGVPSGFAHTPAGAMLGAVQILGRLSWAAQTQASMRAVAKAATTPAADALAAVTYGPPTDPSLIPQVAGIQMLTYHPAEAVINVALRFGGTLRVAPARMAWTAGDWKLAGTPGPLAQSNWAAINDLTGYLIFAGQPTQTGP